MPTTKLGRLVQQVRRQGGSAGREPGLSGLNLFAARCSSQCSASRQLQPWSISAASSGERQRLGGQPVLQQPPGGGAALRRPCSRR